jgi:hypothetical protein
MPSTKNKILTRFAVIIFLVSIQHIQGQTNSETPIHSWYNTSVGKENLDINNGTLYLNYYKTANKTHSYLNSEQFENGNVVYNNQNYTDFVINYDIFKDDLLLKPNGINDRRSVILISKKIESFYFSGKKFVNLNYNQSIKADFIKGFYEENIVSEKIAFYIKHNKEIRKSTTDGKIYDDFKVKNEFVLKFKNEFYYINSKKNILDIFPELKIQIDNYYLLNANAEESNKTEFMESLFRLINSILK